MSVPSNMSLLSNMALGRKSMPLIATLFCLCASLPARAQHVSLSLGRETRHSSFSLNIGWPFRRPSYTNCEPRRVWVAGHYETRVDRVWVNGCSHEAWVPARFEWRRDACGRAIRICVRAGSWTTVTDPGHYEARNVEVWVPGAWRFA